MKTYRPLRDDQDKTYDRILTTDGTELVAIQQISCVGCAFHKGQEVDDVYCAAAPMCGSVTRTDGRSVIWVKA